MIQFLGLTNNLALSKFIKNILLAVLAEVLPSILKLWTPDGAVHFAWSDVSKRLAPRVAICTAGGVSWNGAGQRLASQDIFLPVVVLVLTACVIQF